MNGGPPPPPPPPNVRGPPPPQFRGPPQGGPGGPPPQGRPPGPPQGQGFPPLPFRQESMRISDITPPRLMDEATCLKKLTTYAAFTIRKAPVNDPKKDKPTWARSEVNDEKLDQSDMIKQIKRLNETGKPVAEKKAALFPNQATQITKLLDELIFRENDRNFEWTLAQIDRREKTNRNGLRETTTMTVFFKRTPLKELNPVVLHREIERARHERMMQQNRPPPPQQQQPPPPPPQQNMPPPPPPPQIIPQGGPPKGGPQIDRKQSKSRLPVMKKDGRPPKKYHSDSSSQSSYSDYDSDSDFSRDSSNNTTLSSRSRGGDKRYKGGRVRSYSRHRPEREHRKQYYVDSRGYSPERPGQYRDAAPRHYSVPDVPRITAGGVSGFDPVAAAYQAGKIDADTERYNRERELELERERLERERYAPPPRPFMVDRPVIIERTVPIDRPIPIERAIPIEPRAVVSYRPEARHYETLPIRHLPRYVDERYEDFHSPRDDDYDRRERYAEDYIGEMRRPREFVERRRSDFVGRPEKVVYQDLHHPFAPKRYPPYPPSTRSDTDGW